MFRLFPLLPKELRLHIWTLASFIPQDTIAVIYPLASSSSSSSATNSTTTNITKTNSSKFESLTPHFRACTPVPAILHTSFESRSTGLQYYTRVFPDRGGEEDGSEGGKESERIIYVNKSVDTVIICLPTFRHVIEGVAGEVLMGKMTKIRGGEEIDDREEARTGPRRRQENRNQTQSTSNSARGSKASPSASTSPPSSPWTKGQMMRSFAWRNSFPTDPPTHKTPTNHSPQPEAHPQKDIFIVIKPFNRKENLFTDATQDLHRAGLNCKNVSATWFEEMGDWDVHGVWDRSWGELFGEMEVQRERGDGWEDVDD